MKSGIVVMASANPSPKGQNDNKTGEEGTECDAKMLS
jgi:hypothetical protein